MSDPLFLALLKRERLPLPVAERTEVPPRRFRFDYAWEQHRVALEVEGGVYTRGRHTRPTGFLKDIEKYNLAASLGWRLLRTTPSGLHDLETIALIRQTLTPCASTP